MNTRVTTDPEQLEKGLVKANKAMYDAATGKNKDVAALFRVEGIAKAVRLAKEIERGNVDAVINLV